MVKFDDFLHEISSKTTQNQIKVLNNFKELNFNKKQTEKVLKMFVNSNLIVKYLLLKKLNLNFIDLNLKNFINYNPNSYAFYLLNRLATPKKDPFKINKIQFLPLQIINEYIQNNIHKEVIENIQISSSSSRILCTIYLISDFNNFVDKLNEYSFTDFKISTSNYYLLGAASLVTNLSKYYKNHFFTLKLIQNSIQNFSSDILCYSTLLALVCLFGHNLVFDFTVCF